jgi:hypothetical protein
MLTLFIATACQVIDDGEISYYQFTPDDLSYLYYDQDTLLFTKNINYIDTVVFLRNDTDTIIVEAKTKIESFHTLASWSSKRNLYGESTLLFSEEDGFAVAQISVSRSTKTLDSDKFVTVGTSRTNGFARYIHPTFDTALVLNEVYDAVYKIFPPEEDNTGIQSIYFAKHYGFIKIERTDGKKLELISIKSKK